jgi:SWI/SNF-related matrix-associated actin-dependent regulator 1 of chromatin subfamily A
MITGTPALSRPLELFTILTVLRPEVFSHFKDFGNRYCDPKPRRFGPAGIDYGGASNLKELKFIMQSGFYS